MRTITEAQWEKYVTGYLTHLTQSSNDDLTVENETLPIDRLPPIKVISKPPLKPIVEPRVITLPRVRLELPVTVKPALLIKQLPILPIPTPPQSREPLRVGDFLLWPDPEQERVFFSLATPRSVDFSLTVKREVLSNGTTATTGGTAILTISVYTPESLNAIERYRQEWTQGLGAAGLANRNWKFLPLSLRNLQASLILSDAEKRGEPQINNSTNAGTATCLIELSSAGALAWKDLLEQRRGNLVQGVCKIRVSYCAQVNGNIVIKEQELSATLGALLSPCGPPCVTTINPQQNIVARLIVDGDELLERTVLNLHPNSEAMPQSHVFDSRGGEVALNITSANLNAVAVAWSAEWTFKPERWPVIKETGKLSTDEGWIEQIKPSAWLYFYQFAAQFVDVNGAPVADARDYRLQGSFTYKAPYLPTGILSSVFEVVPDDPVTKLGLIKIYLPKYPQQPPGELILFLASTVKGKGHVLTQRLPIDNPVVLVRVFPDARIELKTATDEAFRLTDEANLLDTLLVLD